MEARIVELKGTPEEIANVLRTVPDLERHGDRRDEGHRNGRELPEDVRDWLGEWGIRGTQRKAFEAFIQKVLSVKDVRIRITAGREGSDSETAGRVGFVRNGSRKAFAFVGHRGKMFVRLPSDTDVSDFPHATARSMKAKPGTFGVTMYVRSEAAVDEAVQLFLRSYEKASG
jgi:hypothetical protein